MVEAWFMDDSDADQRLPHRKEPNEPVGLEELRALGVAHWKLDPQKGESDPELQRIRDEQGYSYADVITVSPDKLPNYEQKLKAFFEEHLHADNEIRYCLEGSGYFDVRDKQDRWIRIKLDEGDLITLPAGIYHRFTLDSNNYIKAMRLFVGDPVWTPLNRPVDDHPARAEYLKSIGAASGEAVTACASSAAWAPLTPPLPLTATSPCLALLLPPPCPPCEPRRGLYALQRGWACRMALY